MERAVVVLTSGDKGFVPYLRLHPLLSLKKRAQRERKREKAAGYYGGAEARPKCQGGKRKKRDGEMQREASPVSWPWLLTGLARSYTQV